MTNTISPHRATLRWSPTFNRFALPFVLSFLSVLPLTAAGALFAQEAAADAEAEEETTVDPTEAFLNSFDPSKSFSKLLLPNVAERVGLTKDQTAEVNRLMAERATKLGQASRDQWPDIVRENEAALKAVLTPAQLSLFDVTRTEQKIVLRFSKERWADVLKWIAGELGMQLVMDAPPPGTFTYVDKTEYSPKEALDILCGVLQLKGYTLVRQNENLFLHDLKKGPIPLQLVPKITPLQLPAQSPNDIVQLTMPLGGRPTSSALTVAKQFLGPYGSAEIGPSSGYLTVTDTVHALREVLPAVLAIPVSTKPSSSPLWADYPLTNVEPAVVKEQIEHFLPTAKPLVNPASRTISFLALPSEQTIISGIIHRLEAGGDPTREMTFAMYDLSDLTASSQQELAAYSNRLGQSVSSPFYLTRELELSQTIVEGFQKIAPSATITLNPISRQLIVFALPEDQQRIKEAVDQLRKPLTEEEKPQFALYRLQEKGKELSSAELTALRTLIPRGDMTFDAEKGTLLVVAPKDDQEKIAQAVEGLNADYLSQDSQKSFVFYMMTGRQLAQFDSLYRAISDTPEMKGVIPVRDPATRRLSIWATKEQHARIQEIVDQITGQQASTGDEGEETAEGENSINGPVPAGRSGLFLETVRIEKGNLASYAQVLTSLFSGLEVTLDSVSRSVIVCGAREDVIAARQTIEKLTQGEDLSTKVIPFAGSVSPDALQAFQRSQPLVTIITDQKAKQLILIGPFQGVEQVTKGLEVVLNQEEKGTSQTAKTYMPKFVEGSTLTKIVSELFPTLEVSSGENNRIIIRGAVEKVEDAIKTIEGIDIKEDDTVKRSFAAYDVRTMSSVDSSGNPYTPRNLVGDLQKLVPAAKVTYETYRQQIIVWGTEEEHEIIRQAIGNLNEKVTILDQFLRYQIKRADPTLLTSTLQQIYPRLKVKHDAPTNSILVQGNPTTLEEGKALLEMLDPEEPSPFDPTAAVYPFENEPSSAAVSTLRLLAPKARIEVNVLNRCLVVVARPAEHKIIEDAIQKLGDVLSSPEPVLAFYPYEASPTSATLTALTRQFPLARITDMKDDKRLMVIAPPQVQKKVADALGLIAENTKPHDPVLKIYKFREKLDRAFTTTLQSFAPGAKLTLDTANRQLTVVAQQEDIDKIEAQLPMLVDSYADRDVKMIAYTAKGMALETLQSTLAGLHPSVTIKLDTAKKRLLIWGTAAEHAAIAEEIDTINAENDAGAYEGPKVVVYRMDSYRKTLQLSRVVKTMFPNAELIPDQQDQTLMIFASGEEHQRINEIIEQIDNPANENASVLDRFYRYEIKRAASSLLKTSIAQAYPQLNVSVDTASNSLLIQGNPSAIEGVKQFLEVLDPEQPTSSEPTVAVYPLESEPSSAALATLRLMAPKARIEVNPLNRSLVVVARPAEHKIIEETIQKIGGAMAAPEPVLAFYPYETPPTSATLAVLSRQVPLARITDLREDKKLMVVAPPLVQEKVAETLGLIAENTTSHDPILKIYKFREKLDSTFTATLQSFAPGAKLTLDTANRQLTVVAQQDDIDKIEAQLPTLVDSYADRDVKMIAYTAKGMAVETLQSTIAGFHPTVTIKLDPAKKRLLIWGTAAEHAAIAEEIDKINAENDAGPYDGPKFVVYRLDNFRKALQLTRIVKTMFPNAELIPDPQDQSMTILATGEEHQRINEIIEQIDNPENENASVFDRFYRYQIKRAAASLLTSTLAQVYPQLKVSIDSTSNSLLIQGNPNSIEGVKPFLEMLDPEQPSPSDPTVAVYPLEHEPSSAALATLRLMAPSARIEVNSLNRSLVVVARPAEHKIIEETIKKIGGAMAAPEPVLAFYSYENPPTSATLAILSRQAPTAQVTDLKDDKKLMVVATPLVQEKVAETLGLIAENTAQHDPILKIYKFREKLDSTFTATLQTFAPNAKLTLDTVNRQLTVVAQQDDIDKIEAQLPTLVDSYADRDVKMVAYTAKGMAVETLQSTIAGFHPTVTIKLDPAKKRLLIWGTAAEHAAIAEEIDKINAENDAGPYDGPKFVVYRMDSYLKSLQLMRVVRTMFPNAELIPDPQGQSMMIFAAGEEHQQIKEIIEQIDNPENENASVFDRFYRYQIKRAAASLLSSTLAQVYPQLRVTVDSTSNSLLIQGNPSSIESVKQFLEMLDPEEPSPSDPTVVVYPLEHEPSSAALATLRLMAPSARIEVNSLNRSLVVVARPAEHKIIEETIRKIGGALEATEPVLAFYPYQTPPSTATMSTLASLAPTARITDLKDDKKLMVIALPLVQKKVAEILGLIAENTKENDPVLKIYSFREKLDSAFTATLQTFAPNAKLTLDTANRQLTVVAQPEEIDKIEAQLPTLVDSYADRDRKMIAYPIKGMDLETLQSTLVGLYPSVTIRSDPVKKRLLIWGTAADHATIAEEIDKINAEHQAGPYDGPKVVVYQVEDYRQSLQLTRIVKTLFPDAEVIPELTYYSGYSARQQSVTIFASQEEHQRITELIEQLNNPSNEEKLALDTFSFGRLDPAAVESTLRAMLPAALSGSPLTLRQSAPSASSPYGSADHQSFFRVDPDSRTVSVYAKPKDLQRIHEGIEGMVKAAEEQPQVASKVFPLSSPIAAQLAHPLQQRLPQSTVTVSSPAELIVFGTTDDLAKAEEFLKGVDTTEGAAETRRFAPVTIPPDSLYPRASLISQLVTSFSPSGGYAYPGASGNQIVLYGTNRMIERMTEYLEACASAKEKEYYQTYPVKNLSVTVVIDMLLRLCPNATITPNGQNRMITVFGSVFVQKQVEEALAQIDVQRADGNEFEIRYYELGSLPTSAYGHIYHIIYTYIVSQTPQASMIPDISGRQIVVVATRQEQEAIGQFVDTTLKNFEANAPLLEVYRLKSINLSAVAKVVQSVTPSVVIFPGKRPDEFFAWAIPSDHERLRHTLAQLESIDEEGPRGMLPKIYSLDKRALESVLPRLRESIPTAVIYPLADNRVIVWGSDAEHRLAAELLGVVAEAFPELTVAKYSPVHVPLTDLYYFLLRKYTTDAIIYPSESGDLIVRAPRDLQEKIAGEIKQFDVPTAEEARPTAKAYDVSSIPTASLSSVIPNILRVVPEAIFLPTQTPGYFVIYARPEAQKKVADLVSEMVKVQPWLKTRTERYTLKNISQTGAITLLRPLAPAAVMVPGTEHNQLIVSAKEEEHERIAEALEKAAGQGDGNLVNRIYHLERADLTRAQTALMTLYPTEVRCLIDPLAHALTVNASPEYQKKVEDFLAELDRVDEATQPKVETFSLTGVNPTVVMTPLKSFYATDPNFQVHYDTAYRTLVVRGSQKQINFANALIDRIRTGGLSDPTLVFKTYTMRNPWSFYTIRNVFANQGRDLYMFQDYSTGKLLVMARPEEHQVIDDILTAMAPEKTQLEIFDLVYVDPTTAYNIISTMLENDGSFVDVQYDASSNRLYVRANAHKLEEIRRFLIEAGEKDLEKKGPISDTTSSRPNVSPVSTVPAALGAPEAPAGGDAAPSVTGSGAMRTIRAGGADLRQAVAEVQKQWSLKNPINVLEQGDSVIQTRPDAPAEEQPAQPSAETKEPPAEAKEPPAAEQPTSAVERLKKWAAAMSIAPVSGAALMEWVPAEQPPEQPAAEQQEVAPGIYAVMGQDGSLMITSSDTEALEKFQEALLAAVAQQREAKQQTQERPQSQADSSGGGSSDSQNETAPSAASFGDEKNVRTLARQNVEAARAKLVMEDKNFSVYKVEEVSVDILLSRLTYYMADRINPPQSAFTPSASSLARGITMKTISSGPRLTFTPDRVLNTIMVKGNKVDRDEAGAMITLLDRPELFPQPITKPFKVPVKNTTVQKMATQVLNAFQQKFINMRLPGNQVPRVSPNTETNTLEIYAPESLAMEIAEYVKETDEEILRDPNRKQVQVVKLQHINSSVLQKYLTSLRASQYQFNFTTPYMFNPNSYYRRVPGQ